MVRVQPTGKGQEVVEVAPKDCANGHRRMAPTWAQCPVCLAMCRQWRCLAEEGCDDEWVVDPDHAHRAEPPSQGARRGG